MIGDESFVRAAARAPSGCEVVLDLSRLLSRVLHATPTGVDRVEMAYARELIRSIPDRLAFAAVHPTGLYGRLDDAAVRRFLDRTERRWDNQVATGRAELRAGAAAALVALRPRRVPRRSPQPRVYLQASPHHLHDERKVAAILQRENARLVCLVHDLIPIEYPEYARPDGAALHEARMLTMGKLASGIVSNSHATAASLRAHLDRLGFAPPIAVAHLGTHPIASEPLRDVSNDPYFVCVGTIEPRKNHLLLLNIWRRLVEERGAPKTPRLILIGRRGWENENIIDMLDRCPALADRVEELSGLPDRAVAQLLAGARALLLPSFAEGFGMPVTEALGAGVPVICSDLPALREAGGAIPDYLDPLDGPAWMARIVDYSGSTSTARARQLERLAGWRAPDWRSHLDTVLDLVEKAAR